MRGIEAALTILTHDTGQFPTEALRKLADREKMKSTDISLASSLIYIVMRRKELWEKIAGDYLRSRENLPAPVVTAVTMGIGGLLELRRFSGGVLINGIIEYLKHNKSLAKYSSVVNAILHKVIESQQDKLEKFSRSSSSQARAMLAGVPTWTLPAWSRTWNNSEMFEIFAMMNNPSYSSLRVSPNAGASHVKSLDAENLHSSPIISSRENFKTEDLHASGNLGTINHVQEYHVSENLEAVTPQRSELPGLGDLHVSGNSEAINPSQKVPGLGDLHYHVSEISGAINLHQSILPLNVPGFKEGICTVQSESSILTASLVSKFYSGKDIILDMCSGRGIKAAQILQENPDSKVECWELSEKKSKSAEHELERLSVKDRAIMKVGDALSLDPVDKVSFVVLDAPCSCSGTWNRKPESKWRLDWGKFDAIVDTQKKLLERAVNLCESGGHILYITCSLLKQENESVIAEVLSHHAECAEVSSFITWNGNCFKRGKPYGIYILPVNSWLDGFYCSLILKR
ncbi:MAG: RsmB/NOP family class I SAM-dependent RNA methyltransferase [Synergistaceae bacterium]|nr:RsmB/NOP family class I SAM-dependent RNA methyltransferase [Synergistaceae bacterium]